MNDDDQSPNRPMTLAEYAEKAAKESVSARGFICSKCGGRRFEVIYTRALTNQRIQRRRACCNCGFRVTTTERVIG